VRGRGTTGSHSLSAPSANPRVSLQETHSSEDDLPVQATRMRGRGTTGSHSLSDPSVNPRPKPSPTVPLVPPREDQESLTSEDVAPVQAPQVRGRGTMGSHSLNQLPQPAPSANPTASTRGTAPRTEPVPRGKPRQATPPSEDDEPDQDTPASEDDRSDEPIAVRGRGVSGLRSTARGFGGERVFRMNADEDKLGEKPIGSGDEETPRVRGRGAIGSFASGGSGGNAARFSNGRAKAGGNGRSLFGAALSGMGR
jgi:hypothetical protein